MTSLTAPAWSLPARFAPQLVASDPACLQRALADPARYAVEEKIDGVRALAVLSPDRRVTLRSRRGRVFSCAPVEAALQRLADAIPLLYAGTVLDGELASADFSASLSLLGRHGRYATDVRYVVFDLPYLGGADLRFRPWHSRRTDLERLEIAFSAPLQLSHLLAPTPDLFERIVAAGGEGVVVKERTSRYRCGSRVGWMKHKRSDHRDRQRRPAARHP